MPNKGLEPTRKTARLTPDVRHQEKGSSSMSVIKGLRDKFRLMMGLRIQDPRSAIRDPKRRLEFLKRRIDHEELFSVPREIYDIAVEYAEYVDEAAIALAECLIRIDDNSISFSPDAERYLLILGPRAIAAQAHFMHVLEIPLPSGYDPNESNIENVKARFESNIEHIIEARNQGKSFPLVSQEHYAGQMIETAHTIAARVLASIRSMEK